MNYQEWKKKNGQILIFCNLEDILMDYYETDTMYEVQKHLNHSNEYTIQCPFCKEEGHVKEKLYIKGNLTVGHCFYCTRAFINITDDITYNIKTPKLNQINTFDLVKINDPSWDLEMYYNEFDDYDEIGYKYLMSRHKFLDPLYKILGFKFCNHNIIMPFFFHGELIYYQIRFTNKNPIRYLFPKVPHKPIYSIECNECKNLIICEGVYDAVALLIMYPDKTPIAVLGSSVSDYQIEMIRTYTPESITVYMDDTEKSIKVRNKLQSVINNVPYYLIKSNGEDPEEKLKRLIKRGKY